MEGEVGVSVNEVCAAKPPCFLKRNLQGREGRGGCRRWTWGREVAAVSRRFDVDLKRRRALPLLKKRHRNLQDAEGGDRRLLREQSGHFLSTHSKESRKGCAGKCGGARFCDLGVKPRSKEANGARKTQGVPGSSALRRERWWNQVRDRDVGSTARGLWQDTRRIPGLRNFQAWGRLSEGEGS